MAGGAPIVVSDWAAVGGGPQPATALSQSQFDSLPDRPRDGTFLQSGATGRIWRVVKGVATYVPSWAPYGGPQPSVVVDQAALDNAGTGGVWNRLTSGTPAPRMTGPDSPRHDQQEGVVHLVRRLLVVRRRHLRRALAQGPVRREVRLVVPSGELAGHRGD